MFLGLIMLFWLLVFLFDLIMLLTAIFTRNSAVRIICGILCLCITGASLAYWVAFSNENKRETLEAERRKVGRYVLDLKRSEMEPYKPELFSNLTVSLNEDNTFSFNRSVPFLPGTKGIWRYVQGYDIAYSEFDFRDTKPLSYRSFQFDSDGKMLSIYTPLPMYGQPQVELLYFVRKP